MGVFLLVFSILSILCHFGLCMAEEDMKQRPGRDCRSFQCGKLGEIKFPFANAKHSPRCGLLMVDGCDNDIQKIQLERGGRWYEVQNISQYDAIFIRDENFSKQLYSRNCETFENLRFPTFPYLYFSINPNITLFKCDSNLGETSLLEYTGCNSSNIYYTREQEKLPNLPPQCSLIRLPKHPDGNYNDLFTLLTSNFSLEVKVNYVCRRCFYGGGECRNNSKGEFYCTNSKEGNSKLRLKIGLGFAAAGILMIAICYFSGIYNFIFYWKKKTQDSTNIDAFLESHGPMPLKRYRYSEVKKMTQSFKDQLGQGGYGGVFKGKLPDGRFVAVKVLKESKGNGEEFINEVASISRTSHVNIVTLLGFCYEGSKRALIYEFIANGSLEKYIYEENGSRSNRELGWEILYEIAIGIARGLEYLHRGCNTRILHFDIKPHNILLDEKFCPKISDFGLAKICPERESIISMMGTRGTIGYIAPEVFCRSFGGVSYKSDVYSYGMLVLEMVGGRKNICVEVDNTSEIYFPDWIYKRLERGEELDGIGNEEENQKIKTMMLVSLWCIQTNPSNRPPMSRVVEMLQGSLDSLLMPPRPCLSSPSRSLQQPVENSSTTSSITAM